MDEFLVFLKSEGIKTLLKEIFNGLNVMVGNAFNFFDSLRICKCEPGVDFTQLWENCFVDFCELRKGDFT